MDGIDPKTGELYGNSEKGIIYFKIKLTTQMHKVFNAYASRKGVEANTLRFLLASGERIKPTQTPLQLNMKEMEEIECLLETLETKKKMTSDEAAVAAAVAAVAEEAEDGDALAAVRYVNHVNHANHVNQFPLSA